MQAALTVTAHWRTSQVQHMLEQLKPRRAGMALSVAVNDSARQVEAYAERDVAKRMGLARKDIKDQIKIAPYSAPSTLTAVVRGSGRPLPLILFAAKQNAKGVNAKAWGTSKSYAGAFIATMKSGHRGVFKRIGKERLPIKELWGPGVSKTMSDNAVMNALQTLGQERLQANTLRQLGRYLRSY